MLVEQPAQLALCLRGVAGALARYGFIQRLGKGVSPLTWGRLMAFLHR